MPSVQLINLLQVFFPLIGMVWKWNEGYPLIEVPDFLHLFQSVHKESGSQWLYTWLDILGGISIESMMNDWPWFSLHASLYASQLIPFIVIIINESQLGGRAWPFSTVILGILSIFCGFSTAMPVVSLWILHKSQPRRCHGVRERYQRSILASLFLFSSIIHIGAFSVAFTATLVPSMLGNHALGPLHVMNSLSGVPDAAQVGISDIGTRQARLRQINEMTGTSSGFFMTVGLLCHVFQSKDMRITPELLVWMFLISLITGPAAGGAAILLLRDFIVSGDNRDKSARWKLNRTGNDGHS